MSALFAEIDDRRSAWEVQRDTVCALIMREMLTRFGRNRLGVAWLIFEPLADILMFTALFGMRHRFTAGTSSILFVMYGVLSYMLFRNTYNQVSRGAASNESLLSFRQVRPMDLFVARGLLELQVGLVLTLFLTLSIAWVGIPLELGLPMDAALVLMIMWIMGWSLGVLTACCTSVAPTVAIIIPFLVRPLFWLSGIIFHIDALPKVARDILLWNPLLHTVDIFRASRGLIEVSDGVSWTYPLAWALGLLAMALLTYRSSWRSMVTS
jgi:capsular polysaccharide transport system permease protein